MIRCIQMAKTPSQQILIPYCLLAIQFPLCMNNIIYKRLGNQRKENLSMWCPGSRLKKAKDLVQIEGGQILKFSSEAGVKILPMILSFQNIRGCNKPNKQKSLVSFVQKHRINMMVLIESKLNSVMLKQLLFKFSTWNHIHSFDHHPGKMILILWNPSYVSLTVLNTSA